MSVHQIAKKQPLVHCITNYVVANFTANGLLAVGASPVMADATEEVAQITQLADAVLLNIGTLNCETIVSMKLAGMAANEKGIPVVLDPVGAGASDFRLQTAHLLLRELRVQLVRCNVGELAALTGANWQTKGVDSGTGELEIELAARMLAKKYNCLVAVTGEVDYVTDGERMLSVTGGDKRITKITGTGCLLSALCAAVLTIEGDALTHLERLLTQYKELAERVACSVGTYQIELLNGLEQLAEVYV